MPIVETILEAKAKVILFQVLQLCLELETREDGKRVRSYTDNTATCPFRSPWGRSSGKSQGGSCGNQ